MKLRKRALPDGRWIVEGRYWFQIEWKGVAIRTFTSRLSMQQPGPSEEIALCPPGEFHFASCIVLDEHAAEARLLRAKSILGQTT